MAAVDVREENISLYKIRRKLNFLTNRSNCSKISTCSWESAYVGETVSYPLRREKEKYLTQGETCIINNIIMCRKQIEHAVGLAQAGESICCPQTKEGVLGSEEKALWLYSLFTTEKAHSLIVVQLRFRMPTCHAGGRRQFQTFQVT